MVNYLFLLGYRVFYQNVNSIESIYNIKIQKLLEEPVTKGQLCLVDDRLFFGRRKSNYDDNRSIVDYINWS